MNQNMVWARQRTSEVTGLPKAAIRKTNWEPVFLAWMISIALHLVVLIAFGAIKFSQSKAKIGSIPIPTANISQVRNLVKATPVVPKPKVKRVLDARHKGGDVDNKILVASQIFDVSRYPPKSLTDFARPSVSQGRLFDEYKILQHRIEFFGSWTDERKICFVVDCSGSMKGIFGQVRDKLKASIQSLQQDQYFCVIFFGNGQLIEFRNGTFVRATQEDKLLVNDFIDLVQPAGQTNALAALERALKFRDEQGLSPSVVYFLTDGFELTTEDVHVFSQRVRDLLTEFAPATRINTIGFLPRGNDRKMLEAIARQSNGEFVFIGGSDN